MAKTIPLIRAAVLGPAVRWMQQHDLDLPDWLVVTRLDPLNEGQRERQVPLGRVFESFRMLAKRCGPDACARLVAPQSLEDLGIFGAMILGGRPPREALARSARFLPRFSTHEIVSLRPIPGGLRFQAGWSLVLDDEALHC